MKYRFTFVLKNGRDFVKIINIDTIEEFNIAFKKLTDAIGQKRHSFTDISCTFIVNLQDVSVIYWEIVR